MNCFKTIIELQDILFPKFYTAMDSENNEYIFLKTQDSMINSLDKVSDMGKWGTVLWCKRFSKYRDI